MTPAAPRVLRALDPERVRYRLEEELLTQLGKTADFDGLAARWAGGFDATRARRDLLARSLRLSPSMAPEAHAALNDSARVLGIRGALELYQSAGPENAAMHLVPSPILVEVQGHLLTQLDDAGLRMVFGHELGHYLAHGSHGERGARHVAARVLARGGQGDVGAQRTAQLLQVAAEITADRFALLSCQDLGGLLRAQMSITTGLPVAALTWDTEAYLAQCQELMEACLTGSDQARHDTHPEHHLRAYAAWLFSETDVYAELTGQGPGTRSLTSVEDTLDRILKRPELNTDYDPLEPPPLEVHECALAGAVIVAWSDGQLATEESERIEQIFAPLVPDWQTYLDRDAAHQRFADTAPIVRAGGADYAQRCFVLLVHMLGADGTIDEREVGAVLGIGAELGQAALFERGMVAALEALGVRIVITDVPPLVIPLPARRDDVLDALDAFLDGVGRRGVGSIPYRKLLRLIGQSEVSESAVRAIDGAFVARQVSVTPALQRAKLDDVLQLTAPPRTEDTDAAAQAPLDPSRQPLIRGLSRLRDQLISGDGRSPSVRLRVLRNERAFDLARLEKVSLGMGERALEQARAGRVARLLDAREAGTHRAAEDCGEALQKLDRAHRDRVEETGSHDLYLGYPFLAGAVARQTSLVAYPVRAPLLLYPVQLVGDGRGARSWKLTTKDDEDPIVNQSLVRLIFNKLRFAFPDSLAEELDELAADRAGGLDAVLAKLRDVGVDITARSGPLTPFETRTDLEEGGHRLELEEIAVLGLFPQSSSDLLQDYDAIIQQLGEEGLPVTEVLAAATVLLPAALRGDYEPPPPAQTAHPLMSADPTQRRVLHECLQHPAMVIDGPPGTGKSQVIANLVLDALRRGERVAVVCEKRAALDVVYQRIEKLGLRHAMALVHDAHEDRKAVYAQIAERLEGFTPRRFDEAAASQLLREHASTCEELDARRGALAIECPNAGLRAGELLTLVSASAPTPGDVPLELPASLRELSRDTLREVLTVSAELHGDQAYWARGTAWRAEPGQPERVSLADHDDQRLATIATQVDAALDAARAFEARRDAHGVTPEALDGAAELLAREDTLRPLRAAVDEGDALYLAARTRDATDEAVASFRAAEGELTLQRAALAQWDEPIRMEVSPQLVAAVSLLSRYAGRFVRFFVWGWWMARSFVNARIAEAWPERAGHPLDVDFLRSLASRVQAAKVWSAAESAMRHLGAAPGLRHRRDLEAYLPLAAQLVVHQQRLQRSGGALEAVGLPRQLDPARLREWDALVASRREAQAHLDALRSAIAVIRPYSPGLGTAPTRAALEALRERVVREGAAVARADGRWARAKQLFPALPEALDALVQHRASADATTWQRELLHAWARAQLARLGPNAAQLASLGTAGSDEAQRAAVTRLASLDERLSKAELERVLATLDQAPLLNVRAPEKHARRSAEQSVWESLLKETRKKRSLLALRTFVRQFAPGGLLDVVPVWLLSPETMAILFPREPLFDLVVFDEASQCTVESGLPVLLRAKRVVVAGDEKQMPPTSFFQMGASRDGEDGDGEASAEGAPAPPSEADEPAQSSEREARDMLTAESLLTLTRSRVRHTALAWHYRCQDESLIAFSNHAMYGGNLLTIPSPRRAEAAKGLRFLQIEHGEYDAGVNVPEAERVVDLIAELLAEPKPPTIGVVSFNLKQRAAVLAALDRRSASDAAFAEAWSRAEAHERLDERPFVKNLEAVQGDERDVIIFTLAHAPVTRTRKNGTADVYVPARFGPLGQRGGERRLNVAISRAKQRCYIVSSFSPEQLSTAGSSHVGPQLFKRYLEYAQYASEGHVAQAEGILDRVRESRRPTHVAGRALPIDGYVPLATQLGMALEAAGIAHELNVGTSDFRVPIALVDPLDPTRFTLAILVDETGGDASAYDTFVHRPNVLRDRGWQVLRVDAATWCRRPDQVIREIKEQLEALSIRK